MFHPVAGDGIIVAARTREVLALSLGAAMNAEAEETKVGKWRI